MIKDWLAQKIGLPGLNDRLDLLERELAEHRATIAIQNERVRVAETLAITATRALERMDRQMRGLTRVTRSGAARLKTLRDAQTSDKDAQTIEKIVIIKGLEQEIGRFKAALEVLECRLDNDTEQAKRGIAGLFARIEATRAYGRSSTPEDPPAH